MLKKIGFVLVIFFMTLVTFCNAQEQTQDQLIETLMQKSGMNTQIEQIPQIGHSSLTQAFQQSPQEIPEIKQEKIHLALTRSFYARNIKYWVTEEIKKSLSEEEIKNVLEWFDSPLGQKITALEEAASTPDAYLEIQTNMNRILSAPSIRIFKIKQLDEAIKGTEISLEMAKSSQFAIAASMSAAIGRNNYPTFEMIMEELENNRPQLFAKLKKQILALYIYTYQELTDSELDQYVYFLESGPAQLFYASIFKGLNQGIETSSREFGNQLGLMMKNP